MRGTTSLSLWMHIWEAAAGIPALLIPRAVLHSSILPPCAKGKVALAVSLQVLDALRPSPCLAASLTPCPHPWMDVGTAAPREGPSFTSKSPALLPQSLERGFKLFQNPSPSSLLCWAIFHSSGIYGSILMREAPCSVSLPLKKNSLISAV